MTPLQPTATDQRLKNVAFAAFFASQVFNILGVHAQSGPIIFGLAVPFFLVAVAAGSWRLWRWYDRRPDGRRGE